MSPTNLDQDTRAQNAQINRDAELMEQLISHPGWARLCVLIENVGANYFDQVCAPLDNVMEVTKTEFAKGTLNGLKLVASLPHAKIEESKTIRAPSNEEE